MKAGGWAAGVVALTVIVVSALGFVVLPALSSDTDTRSLWVRICFAAGVLPPASEKQSTEMAAFTTTDVVLTPRMLAVTDIASVGRGATFALRCTSCHGARGVSGAGTPNLAGQYPAVVYKELRDYLSGARTSAVMGPIVVELKDSQLRDLAAWYAYLPRLPLAHGPVPPIVASGDPMRNVAPCAVCHGPADYKAGSAWLAGDPASYVRAQLIAFASGARHNDISQQMRNIARGLSPAEIEVAATYYAQAQP